MSKKRCKEIRCQSLSTSGNFCLEGYLIRQCPHLNPHIKAMAKKEPRSRTHLKLVRKVS